MSPRQQLRARYPAIVAHASLSFGDGWAGLLDVLCERRQFYAEKNGMPPVEITQAKEKNGELSVLYSGGLIDLAESMSSHICEVCRKPGKFQDGPQVFRTRCCEHVAVTIRHDS